MSAQQGLSSRRRLLLGLGAPLLLGAAGLGYAMWPEEEKAEKVRTDVAPLNRRFWTALGDVTDAHWLGYGIDESNNDRTVPRADSRMRLVGVAHLKPGTANRIMRDPAHHFEVGPLAGPPAALKPYIPSSAAWKQSVTYDKVALEEGLSVIPSGTFRFDAIRDLVYFDYVFLYS
ncbi:hypothetical protein OHA37_34945 [Streptomyces sp. NBC_00335]|uniref:hypothetical protein n=1 Tax=unclassified Streptomyces TaxID=2593676 RepID=UPI0022541B37|nr:MULTISPECIES: hypothetical protein [unclassified Streptomyces]MCX5409040.1 hypothetical protein [Streptomyces sp. NBC_00086]